MPDTAGARASGEEPPVPTASAFTPQARRARRSRARRAWAVIGSLVLALAASACGGGSGSSTTSTQAKSTASAEQTTPANPSLVSASSVKACMERLGYIDEGRLPKVHLHTYDPNKEKNVEVVSQLEYNTNGTGFEENGGPVNGEVYVGIAASPEEAAKIAGQAQRFYVSKTPEELIRIVKHEPRNPPKYKIGSKGNVAYVVWQRLAVAARNVEKCAAPQP